MTESDVISRTTTRFIGKQIRLFDSVDSTNTVAKRLAQEGSRGGMVVIAQEQSAGRGRLGRSWASAKGENLTISILLRPRIEASRIGLLSLAAGVAVSEMLRAEYALNASCKWPNDVLLGGKKVCGILSEAVFQGEELSAAIIGIGLNVNQASFPPELAEKATSLFLATGRTFDRTEVLCALLSRLEGLYDLLESGASSAVIDRWSAASPMIGQSVRVSDAGIPCEGIVRGIAPDGALLLETSTGLLAIHAGDVNSRES